MHVRNWHIKCKLKIGIYSIIWQCGNDTCIFCKSSCQAFDKRIFIFSLSMTLFFEICTTKILDSLKSWLKPFLDNKDYWKVDIKTREKYHNSFIFYNPKLTKIYFVNVESIRDIKNISNMILFYLPRSQSCWYWSLSLLYLVLPHRLARHHC